MKKIISLIFLCVVSLQVFSQSRTLYGYAVDKSSKEMVSEVRASVLRSDSTLIDTATADKDGKANFYMSSLFKLRVPSAGKYIVRCTAMGYNTIYKNIDVRDSRRNHSIDMGTFYLTRDKHMLNEVVVTATKIKMLVRGDTVVYNAGAFQLSEGSMLEALIKQLPGVELKSNGKIMVNGKYVESLFINGKEFFDNDPKVALQNLPSYMVNKVKVYNKKNELSGLPTTKRDEHLVIDVNLKKKYSAGLIANIGLGRGSNDRYTARLFGLRFSDKSRLSLVGNINNVNDSQQPGEEGSWTPSNATDGGLQSLKSGGVSYRYDNGKKFFFQSDNTVSHTDMDSRVTTASETFLTSGNAFARSMNMSRSKATSFNTNNFFNYHTERLFLRGSWSMNYSDDDNRSNELSGSFLSDPAMVGANVLDSLFLPQISSRLKSITSNRRRQEGLGAGHRFNTSLGTGMRFVTDTQTKDGLSIDASFNYSTGKTNNYSQSQLDYPSSATLQPDNRNQFTRTPNSSYNLTVNSFYEYYFRNDMQGRKGDKVIMFSPGYTFHQAYNSNETSLYRLDRLNEWSKRQIGMLPSADLLLKALDAQNSYHSGVHENQHKLNLNSSFYWYLGSDTLTNQPSLISLNIRLAGDYYRKSMDYYRNAKYFPISRKDFFFEPSVSIMYITRHSSFINLNYQMTSSAPDLTSLVNITDNTDPLNVMLGNPDLKNAHSHSVQLSFNRFASEGMRHLNMNIGYHIDQNAVAMGFVYDKSSGIRTSKPENVNGNWGINAGIDYGRALDKKGRFTFSTNTSADKSTNVDLVSVAGASASTHSTIHNMIMSEKFELDFHQSSKLQIGTQFTGNWSHATSRREDFTTINTFDFNYGMTAQLELPLEFQFNTDLTMFSRRGYQDSQMNTNEMVWNARLSKQLFHGNLTLMADGFDLLGNLSNVQRTLNAQGRVETFYNVIPHYVMFHAVYRFNCL